VALFGGGVFERHDSMERAAGGAVKHEEWTATSHGGPRYPRRVTPSHAPPAGARPGDVLAGKYRVERVLGQGGMGVVVAAHHIQLDEKVALKFLLPEALSNGEAVTRFAREARAAVKIKNEHVARVIDVGQLENGAPYMVMEYLEGSDLSGWLKQRGAMQVEQAVDFILQACEALADAHVLGIVHRDLKPANLFCIRRSDGQASIKVLDFGISKVSTPGGGHDLTRTSALMGSPYYMSPEQMQTSKGVDARSDIWSLGIILFELVTGRPPFDAEAVTELAIKIATQPTPDLRLLAPTATPGLERVVAGCLEKDRARRFQTVADLAVALQPFGSSASRLSVERVLGTLRQAGMAGQALPAPVTALSPAGIGSPGTSASWGNTGAPSRPNGKPAIGIVVASIAVGVLVTAAVVGVALIRKPASLAPSFSPPTGASAPAAGPLAPAAAASAEAPSAETPSPALTPAPAEGPGAAASGPTTLAPPVPTASAAVATHPGAHPSAPHGVAAGVPPSPSAKPAARASCNPPYVIDSAGYRQYKPECL
jgi:serine/threonine-protein kinase